MAKYLPNEYGVKLFQSLWYFIDGRQIDKCRNVLRKCRHKDGIKDVVYLYNLAFIEAYSGNLSKVRKLYSTITNRYIDPNTLAQIEASMCTVLKLEPNIVQLHFCLGIINWKVKNDLGVTSLPLCDFAPL